MEKKRLSMMRKERGLSQRELASLLCVSPGLVGLWELGKRTPTLKMALNVSNLFGVSVESIIFSNKGD